MLRKTIAWFLVVLLTATSSPAWAADVIQVGTFLVPEQWSQEWASQLDMCRVQANVETEHIIMGHGTFVEELFLMETTGNAPDVLLIPPERVAPIVDQNLLENLDPWVERTGLDQSMWLPTALTGTRFQGVLFGFPAYIVNYTYAYNIDILLQRGLAFPAPDEWLTWNQVRDIARKAHLDQDGDGVPEVTGFVNGTVFVQFLPFIRQMGVEIYDQDGFVRLNTPEVHEAVNFFIDMNQDGIHDGDRSLFWTGRAATERMGSWEVRNVLANDTPVGTAAGIQNVVKSDVAYPTAWAITRSSDQKDAAWRFLTCLVSREAQNEVVLRGVVPMRRDVNLPLERQEILQGFLNTLEHSGSYPYHVHADYVIAQFDTVMPAVFAGQASANSVLDELERTLNAYIRDQSR